jgi:hypothetical protein
MSDDIPATIDELMARIQGDESLRRQMLADPKATILAETGMTVPDDWAVISRENNGMVELAFENDELPDDYLEVVSGGLGDGGASRRAGQQSDGNGCC